MARFDLYANPDIETRNLLDVQSSHVGILPTRIAIPLSAPGKRIGSLFERTETILAALDRIFGAY
jgi:toxin CcdB